MIPRASSRPEFLTFASVNSQLQLSPPKKSWKTAGKPDWELEIWNLDVRLVCRRSVGALVYGKARTAVAITGVYD